MYLTHSARLPHLSEVQAVARSGSLIASLLASLLAMPAGARAQQDDRIALTVSTPTALGVLLHTGDRLALRPEINLTHSRLTGTPAATGTTLGTSLLLYTSGVGATRTYLAPRLVAQLTSQTSAPDLVTWAAGVSFGAQHRFDRSSLMVFAEGGVQASWFERELGLGGTLSGMQWSTRTAIGLGWYPRRR
jgi:hypothetical protein